MQLSVTIESTHCIWLHNITQYLTCCNHASIFFVPFTISIAFSWKFRTLFTCCHALPIDLSMLGFLSGKKSVT